MLQRRGLGALLQRSQDKTDKTSLLKKQYRARRHVGVLCDAEND